MAVDLAAPRSSCSGSGSQSPAKKFRLIHRIRRDGEDGFRGFLYRTEANHQRVVVVVNHLDRPGSRARTVFNTAWAWAAISARNLAMKPASSGGGGSGLHGGPVILHRRPEAIRGTRAGRLLRRPQPFRVFVHGNRGRVLGKFGGGRSGARRQRAHRGWVRHFLGENPIASGSRLQR